MNIESECPLCHTKVEGFHIDKRDSSFLKTVYKLYGSLIVPIPFVGSYLYGKFHDLLCGDTIKYSRFVCPDCRCSWITSPNNSMNKIGGDGHLITFFTDKSCLVGSLRDNLFFTITKTEENEKATVRYVKTGEICSETYINGKSSIGSLQSFAKIKYNFGLYIGEVISNQPCGWGLLIHRNGKLWYGKWYEGEKNGVGFECDYDGTHSQSGFWRNNNYVM